MKKFLKTAFAALALCSAASGAFAWGTYDFGDGTSLTIDRQIVDNAYEWTYTLYNAVENPLELLTIGVKVDDTGLNGAGDLNSGYFYDYSSSLSSFVVQEMAQNITFSGFYLTEGQSATFKFKTKLMSYTNALHIARDHDYGAMWRAETPYFPTIPEPSSLVALLTGITGLAGVVMKKKA